MEFIAYWVRVGVGLAIAGVSFVVACIFVLLLLALLGKIGNAINKAH